MTTLDIDTGLCMSEDFKRRLEEEVERAAAEGRPYAVVACVPQHFPGEGVADIVQVVAACVRGHVREEDVAGILSDEILAIGLAETAADRARVFAHRLQSDLRLRSYHLRNTVWEAGFACLPEDGRTAQELLHSAIEAAKTRRRRLGL